MHKYFYGITTGKSSRSLGASSFTLCLKYKPSCYFGVVRELIFMTQRPMLARLPKLDRSESIGQTKNNSRLCCLVQDDRGHLNDTGVDPKEMRAKEDALCAGRKGEEICEELQCNETLAHTASQ